MKLKFDLILMSILSLVPSLTFAADSCSVVPSQATCSIRSDVVGDQGPKSYFTKPVTIPAPNAQGYASADLTEGWQQVSFAGHSFKLGASYAYSAPFYEVQMLIQMDNGPMIGSSTWNPAADAMLSISPVANNNLSIECILK